MNPTTVDTSTAAVGTPGRPIRPSALGASARADSENIIRDAVYSPEFRQDSTDVSTITSITAPAAGSPIRSSTATYGLLATPASSHGSSVTTMAMDPR